MIISIIFIILSFIITIYSIKSTLKDYDEIEEIYGSVEMIRRIVGK